MTSLLARVSRLEKPAVVIPLENTLEEVSFLAELEDLLRKFEKRVEVIEK